ncbi:MAG: hypothetical protein VXX20_01155 [Verrucomicrobiota bacterium]|nr:hypothetical protein [Verrucomicrobiota bacterium]
MKLFIIALAIAEKELSTIDGIIGMILGAMVCIAVTLCSMLLCGMKIRIDPEKKWAEEALKYNDDLVQRRPWIKWVVGLASVGSLFGTFLWYCGGKFPS